MSESLDHLLERARRVHASQVKRSATDVIETRPGFVERVLSEVRTSRLLFLTRLERAAKWTALAAACITFILWAQPRRVSPLTLQAAAESWVEIPTEEPGWDQL
jgi:hypothetical protein